MKVGDLVIHQDIKSLGVGVIVEFIGSPGPDVPRVWIETNSEVMYILWSSRDTPTVEMMERLIFIK